MKLWLEPYLFITLKIIYEYCTILYIRVLYNTRIPVLSIHNQIVLEDYYLFLFSMHVFKYCQLLFISIFYTSIVKLTFFFEKNQQYSYIILYEYCEQYSYTYYVGVE